MTILWLIIGLSIFWVAFAYVGYPLMLMALRRFSPRPVACADIAPPISVIITVYNGEKELTGKLEKTLALEYPGEREILVASDGSTDRTDEIAGSFSDRGVRLVRNPENTGKESAQARAIGEANGEILVFTDNSAILERDALVNIVRPFADPTVGCVSSEDVVDPEKGEGAYVRFEMALRRLESETTTLVGLSGSFFAARREICNPWPTDLASDFRMGIEASARGLRSVCEPSARAIIPVTKNPGKEWPRKVRTFRRGIAVLSEYKRLLLPWHGRAALSLWGHKCARFTSPYALVTLFVASVIAAQHSALAMALVIAQGVGYTLGAMALMIPAMTNHVVPRLIGFFVLVNAAVMNAWMYHLTGQRAVKWEPTRR